MELPIVLRNMLGQLTQNNTLVGWNIYEDRHQKICLNIRFDIDLCGHVAGSVDTVSDYATQNNIPRTNTQTCKYRKVSDKQQVRARERLQKLKSSNPTTTKETQSDTNNCDTPLIPDNKKRKHDDLTPEMPRINFNDSSHLIQTPETVGSDDHFILGGEEPVFSTSTPEDPDIHSVSSDEASSNKGSTSESSLSETPLSLETSRHKHPKVTHINCPCCDKIMTATHECDEETLAAGINDELSILNETDNDTCTTPPPIPFPPLPISPNHSNEPLDPYPPDDAGGISASEPDLDSLKFAVREIMREHSHGFFKKYLSNTG